MTDYDTLLPALEGIDTAFYLVHALGSDGDFEKKEVEAAGNFGRAAKAAGVRRIIYLGGLGDDSRPLSKHMRSRHRVGNVLRESGVTVTEFRASIVIGSGSLSYELIRALVRKLPVMITPRWVSAKAQPIAINDVLRFLVASLDDPDDESRVYEIGGSDVMSYAELMKVHGRVRGVKRFLIPVPVLTPGLSSLWLSLVTPLYAQVGRRLIESIASPSVVRDPSANGRFGIEPVGVEEAMEQARRNEDREFALTHWADALSSMGPARSWGGVRFRNRIVDMRTKVIDVDPDIAFAPIQRIGGQTGWYYGDWLWQLRGLMDRALGGVGMRRGRRDREQLREGDVLDCWRVEHLEPNRKLVLNAEMKVPGRAWLQFEVQPEDGGSRVTQTALYDPVGLLGITYWYALYPMHEFVFAGMLRNICRAAEARRDAEASQENQQASPPSAAEGRA